jgi:hypothetical protein
MPLSPKVYTWLCGLFAALGSVTFGYDLGIIASVLVSGIHAAYIRIVDAQYSPHPTSSG